MKRLFKLFGLIPLMVLLGVFLTSCGNNTVSTETSGTIQTFIYETAEFSISIPDGWTTIENFTGEYPEGMMVAFKNNILDSSFTANISVMKEENIDNLTSYDLTQTKLAGHEKALLGYQLLSQEEILVTAPGGETRTLLNQFQGKNSTSGPVLNFMQITVTKADKAFTVTGAYKENEDPFVIDKLLFALKSFTLE